MPYRPDKASSGDADPVMNALIGQLATLCCELCPSGKERGPWMHVLFSLMPSEGRMFAIWSKMDRPSRPMTKKWIRACFLVGVVDALHRGWFPLFECPPTLPVDADDEAAIRTPFQFCLKALDSGTDTTASEHARMRANVPLTISDDDNDMGDSAPEQANVRAVLRKMIGDGVANSATLAAASAQMRDEHGDLYACLGPLLRGASLRVTGQALRDFNKNASPPCRLLGNIDLRSLPVHELDPVLRALFCSVGVPGMDKPDPLSGPESDGGEGPASTRPKTKRARGKAATGDAGRRGPQMEESDCESLPPGLEEL